MSDLLFEDELHLDRTVVDQIVQLEAVRPGLLDHLVSVFQKNFTELISSMEQQLAAGEHEALRIGFHSLKGASASLGALRLSKMAGFAESLAASNFGIEPLQEIREALTAEFGLVRSELVQITKSSSPQP